MDILNRFRLLYVVYNCRATNNSETKKVKNYIKKVLFISLLFNLLLIGNIAFSKRGIITKVNNFLKKETVVSNEQLKSMNNVFVPEFTDTCDNKNGKAFKILIIGNSLSYHGMAKEIGWNYISGMAATSKEKDYAHLLFNQIEKKLPTRNICLRISQFAAFERNLASFKYNSINDLVSFQPDIVIFQLGENVNIYEQNAPLLFQEKYIELINHFKKNRNTLTICTTPFFPSLIKNEIIEKVALETNSYLVDLSHLPLLNSENYAKDEKNYSGDKSIWKVSGIGIHPGDIGMQKIFEQLLITLNASISREENSK